MSSFDIGGLSADHTYTSLVNHTNLFDDYNFSLNSLGSFQLSLDGLSANADLQLLNSSGMRLYSSSASGISSEALSIDNLAAGSYSIQVLAVSGDTSYQLSAMPNSSDNTQGAAGIDFRAGKPLNEETQGTTDIDPLIGIKLGETLALSAEQEPTASPTLSQSGVFTVGQTGQVSFDYLFDGGMYEGELAIFSLEGMAQFTPSSTAFIQEAARRALSDSDLGHVVISDHTEAAFFTGNLGESTEWNFGEYTSPKAFAMRPGDTFAVMLIPDGTVQLVFENPSAEGALRPLFSLDTANPNDGFHVGQIADATGQGSTFVMEDLRIDGWTDRDYNDLIFQVKGATGEAVALDQVIAPEHDWRGTELGQEILNTRSSSRNGSMAKVGSDLASVQAEYETYLEQGNNPFSFQSTNSLLEVYNGQVVIDAVAANDTSILFADLQSLGLENSTTFGKFVSGLLPITAIEEMAALDSLKFARPTYTVSNVGAVTSQGDIAMNADDARTFFGVDGTGVTVGVLSDSYNFLGGATADVASGDLPTDVNVLEDFPDGIDEGRAMLQLIHDVAPGANLAFHTSHFGTADFANGIIELANAGAKVIVDDVYYFAAPMFQDGLLAQAVDTVVANGVSYFSSAGNHARNSYESAFNNSGQTFSYGAFTSILGAPNFYGGTAHDFDPNSGVDIFQSFTLDPGQSFGGSFQWDEPFFSVSGGAGATNEMDIYIFDETGTIVGGGANSNFGGDAVEVFNFTNTTEESANYNFMIVRDSSFGGTDPGLMKSVFFNNAPTINEFATNSSTIYGHANAAGTLAVGAAYYKETPEFGTNPAELENFSSYGSTPILFDKNGNRFATPENRQNPGIVAPDGTNTTFFGKDVDFDGFPNFSGTSAAAPHAAAVAALMLQAAPGTSPDIIYSTLKSTALDMDDPVTPGFDVGFDNATGYGFIDAERAIQELVAPTVIIQVTRNEASEEPGFPGQFTVTRTGNTALPLTLNYTIAGTATNGTDYKPLNGSVTIPAGLSSWRIPLIPIDDPEVEGTETAQLTLTPNLAYKLGNSSSATVQIEDNDRPAVTINATDPNASEAGDPGEFTITRNSNVGDLFVNYTLAGSAINGTDYNALNGSIFIPAGSTTATIPLIPINDTLVEGNETVDVRLQLDPNYSVGTASTATITLADNDSLPPPLLGGNDTIFAGNGNEFIYGGAGNDSYGRGNNFVIDEGSNNDYPNLPVGPNPIYGTAGNDEVYGTAGNETIIGLAGDDIIYGGGGSDVLLGDFQ